MSEQIKINENLLVSELLLAFIPAKRFQVDSWSLWDKFIVYAAELFTTTLANLIQSEYLRIEQGEIKTVRILGIPVSKRAEYFVTIEKRPESNYIIGWLEEKIIDQFRYANDNQLQENVYSILYQTFGGEYHINPGKAFIIEIIKHQRVHLYEFGYTRTWLSNSISLWRNKNSSVDSMPRFKRIDSFYTGKIEINKLWRIIYREFKKFHNLD